MGIDFGIWVATRCNRAAAGVKLKYQYLFNERIPSAKVQTRSIANDRCRENHDYYFLVLILNFKVFLLIIFFNGCVVKAWAQVVAYDSVGYLHPKSKIELRLKPYFALLMPYFPELNGLKLVVRERKQLIPLTTVPSVLNLFRCKKNWKIHINVSNQSVKLFDPILVKNMPDSAIIGVLGHELSHVKDFYTHKRNYILKIFFAHLSPGKIDKFEYNTDLIAIKSGIGHYLKAWSLHTHTKMPVSDFNRKKDKEKIEKERYMKPETIEKWMKQFPEIYPR